MVCRHNYTLPSLQIITAAIKDVPGVVVVAPTNSSFDPSPLVISSMNEIYIRVSYSNNHSRHSARLIAHVLV